jgi:hypothetical protein
MLMHSGTLSFGPPVLVGFGPSIFLFWSFCVAERLFLSANIDTSSFEALWPAHFSCITRVRRAHRQIISGVLVSALVVVFLGKYNGRRRDVLGIEPAPVAFAKDHGLCLVRNPVDVEKDKLERLERGG